MRVGGTTVVGVSGRARASVLSYKLGQLPLPWENTAHKWPSLSGGLSIRCQPWLRDP